MKLRAQNRIVTGALVLLILLVLVGWLIGATPARADTSFTMADRREVPGMATDHHRNRYWVLEKSSGRLTLTAIKPDGTVEGHMNSRDQVTNAQALAFDSGEAYIGDVGGSRSQVTIYQVTEPWPGTEILKAIPYVLTYPDGVHAAQAILVDGRHRLHVVTQGPGAGVYQAPENPSRTEPNALTRVASVPDGVIDGLVLLDGRIALRTADRVLTLDPASWAVTAETALPAEAGAGMTQAVTQNAVLTAVGPSGEVTSTTVPGPAPTSSPTPRASKAPSTQTQSADVEATRTFQQTGTTVAVVGALVVAALAAAFVLVRR